MKIVISKTSQEQGVNAAAFAAEVINFSIKEKGQARIVLSTGSSQFDLFKALVEMDIEWDKVEMFHLDEYIGLPETHPASFRKYLKERFINFVPLKAIHFVMGEGDIESHIEDLTAKIREAPIDLGIVGIGENAHIAFNDPPANFETTEAYIIVNLDLKCKQQQVREGWFPSVDEMPSQAITMTPYQIMQCRTIISIVPHKVKAQAVKDTLENALTNEIPATMLKDHGNYTLFLDEASASLVDKELLI